MFYRGPSFLTVVLFGSLPHPFPPLSRQQVVSLSQSSFVSPVELTDGRGDGRGARSYERQDSLALYKSMDSLLTYLLVCLYGYLYLSHSKEKKSISTALTFFSPPPPPPRQHGAIPPSIATLFQALPCRGGGGRGRGGPLLGLSRISD